LFAITIPLLKPQIVFVMTMNIINGFQMFTEVFINFDLLGGPYNSALTPVMYLYQKGFQNMQMGEASTIGILLAIVIFILTKVQDKILKVTE
jgi:multiple sugar transport system permease protein